jgi:hypothetical protein
MKTTSLIGPWRHRIGGIRNERHPAFANGGDFFNELSESWGANADYRRTLLRLGARRQGQGHCRAPS